MILGPDICSAFMSQILWLILLHIWTWGVRCIFVKKKSFPLVGSTLTYASGCGPLWRSTVLECHKYPHLTWPLAVLRLCGVVQGSS
ncbi:hypothetical protein TEQG_05009 [Trichophyton equinum CBS 127.97]|uniref:Uncharacterized protein n=1 Tax=Trichophyton equinum (strain ATCC MYA-4606 / CBS 127.97) TaxID=559882 RepID=F2PVT3_TRIEC|nr:hypothetical protein TEQG_05009 [Trichophyton equinum CBS 127.97]